MHVIDPWNRGEETVFSQWKLRSLDCGEHMDVSRFEITRVIEVKLFSIICLLADKSIATNVRFIRRKFELGSCLLLDTRSISKENRISMIGNLLSYALLRRYFEQIATENRSESRSIE